MRAFLNKDLQMKMPAINSMSVSDLIDLKDQIEKFLSEKVHVARRDLETQLAKLSGYGVAKRGRPAGVKSGSGRGVAKGSTVAPKYRDAETGATWAGRGLKPKWLSEGLKSGKSLEDYMIAGAKSVVTKVTGKKRGRPAKKAA